MASKRQFWEWNYMGEVIASPRQGLMETFFIFLNSCSGPIGSDAPYSFYFIIIMFPIIIP